MPYTELDSVAGDQPIDPVWGNKVVTITNELQNVLPETTSAVTLSAGWDPYGAPWAVAKVCKAGLLVVMKGLIKNVSGGAFTSGQVATVPAGYRPLESVMFAVNSSSVAPGICRLDVTSAGAVSVATAPSISIANNGFLSLSASWILAV